MTTQHDLDRQLRDFLRDGPEELPFESFDAVRDRTEQTGQRALIGPWRLPTMNRTVIFGLGAVAVVVIGVFLGAQLLGSPGNTGTGGPTGTPRPSVEPTSSADAFLPDGPILVWESQTADEPSVTMTISAPGWLYHEFEGGGYLEKGEEMDNMSEAAVLPGSLPPGTGFYVYGDPCRSSSTKPETPAITVDEIVAALAAQASRDASEPVDVTVGGYAGKMITLHVPDDADFADCEGGEFASYTIEGEERWDWQQGPGQIDDFSFFDVEGSIVAIRATYRPDTAGDLVEEMRSLVESATFDFP